MDRKAGGIGERPLESNAARSSNGGRGGGPSGRGPPWECRAARGRQARPEEALLQEPSWGTARVGSLTMKEWRRRFDYAGPPSSTEATRVLSTTLMPLASSSFCATPRLKARPLPSSSSPLPTSVRASWLGPSQLTRVGPSSKLGLGLGLGLGSGSGFGFGLGSGSGLV